MTCSHKTIEDHTIGKDGARLWKCSACGVHGQWADSWGYWGSAECPKCWTAAIDWVHCSDACKDALVAKHGVSETTGRPRMQREKKPKPRPAWERKAIAAGWVPPGGVS